MAKDVGLIASMTISDRTRKILWARSGNRCAICKSALVIAVEGTHRPEVIGEECHIHSPVPGGPRYNAQMADELLHVEANLILLCSPHHKVIDANTALYPPDEVRRMKAAHEDAIWQLIEGVGTLLDVDALTVKLTSIVKAAASENVLYGSVGEADFAATWLPRLLEGYQYRYGEKPKISAVYLRRVSAVAINSFVERQLLDPKFAARLDSNLARLRELLAEASIGVSVSDWPDSSLPPFHGWMFGDSLLRGDWARGALGHYHVRTPVKLYTRHTDPAVFTLTQAYFP